MALPIVEISDREISTEFSSEYSDLREKLLKYFAGLTQFLMWPFAFLFFKFFFKLKMNGIENIRKTPSPFIVISNHVSFYDSFVFRLVMSFFARNLPLRFMAVNSFKSWYLNFLSTIFVTDVIYALFGVLVVVRGRGINKNLVDAIRIIKNGGNVVVYPEGSIMQSDVIADFKLGAAVLAKKTNATVIPVAMKIFGNSLRKNFIINVGECVSYDSSQTPEKISDLFRNTIDNLYKK